MSSEPSNADVLDAVAMELSRFSQEVVTEVHRLRDQLATEQQRVSALEAEVGELRHAVTSSNAQRAVPEPSTPSPPPTPLSPTTPATAPATAAITPTTAVAAAPAPTAPAASNDIEFAPLTLSLSPIAEPTGAVAPAPTGASLDDLVARVLDEVSEPIGVSWPADS